MVLWMWSLLFPLLVFGDKGHCVVRDDTGYDIFYKRVHVRSALMCRAQLHEVSELFSRSYFAKRYRREPGALVDDEEGSSCFCHLDRLPEDGCPEQPGWSPVAVAFGTSARSPCSPVECFLQHVRAVEQRLGFPAGTTPLAAPEHAAASGKGWVAEWCGAGETCEPVARTQPTRVKPLGSLGHLGDAAVDAGYTTWVHKEERRPFCSAGGARDPFVVAAVPRSCELVAGSKASNLRVPDALCPPDVPAPLLPPTVSRAADLTAPACEVREEPDCDDRLVCCGGADCSADPAVLALCEAAVSEMEATPENAEARMQAVDEEKMRIEKELAAQERLADVDSARIEADARGQLAGVERERIEAELFAEARLEAVAEKRTRLEAALRREAERSPKAGSPPEAVRAEPAEELPAPTPALEKRMLSTVGGEPLDFTAERGLLREAPA